MNNKYIEAKKKSDKIDDYIIETFKTGKSFKVEAGAGTGKTYSLMKIILWIKENNFSNYLKKGQKIACITYTNAAVNVIKERLNEDSFIVPCTIHSFAWENIKKYQKELIKFVIDNKMLSEDFDITKDKIKKVNYELGVKYFRDETLYLHHNDVITLFSYLLDNAKFRFLFASKYPVIFIDEYQDSNEIIINKFIKYFIDEKINGDIQFGFFGDSWQTIYKNNKAIGKINNPNIININKTINFRSCPEIIECLNKIRPDLKQESVMEEGTGLVKVIHCNDYNGIRRSDGSFKGDLPSSEIKKRLEKIQENVNIDGQTTKILMLTHKILSIQQDYENIYNCFGSNFKLGDNNFIDFVLNFIIPIARALEEGNTKELYNIIGSSRQPITSINDKLKWKNLKKSILDSSDDTIFKVLKIIIDSKLIPVSDNVLEIFNNMINTPTKKYNSTVSFEAVANIKYLEFERLYNFLNPESIFSTDHGVKGEEFDNIIFVIGKGWNFYDFENTLPLSMQKNIENVEKYEQCRNLFYVGCSRAKRKLILLITCELTKEFENYLINIFGKENIIGYNEFIRV